MRLVRIGVSLGMAIGVSAVVNEIGPYKRHGGPILVDLGSVGGVHAGDLVVLGLSFAAALWATRLVSLKLSGSR